MYLHILKPVYILSQQLQYNHSSIADVIPSLKQLMNNLSTMIVDENAQPLCGYLITNILEKFHHELNSSVYKVINNNIYHLIKLIILIFYYLI
jgi:hypothetical protein